jgi:hypothetical protein
VEADTLENLFATVPSEDRPKFQKLRQTISGMLSTINVYKVGDEPARQIFIIGKRLMPNGQDCERR